MRALGTRTLLPSLALAVMATQARAQAPAFMEATSEADDGKPATAMWNVVDGNNGSVWCAKSGQKEALNFTFEEPVVVTHLTLLLPHQKGDNGVVDRSVARPKVVFVADVEHRVEAKFKDTLELQSLELTPPAKGRRIVVEFDESYPGAAEGGTLCLAELSLRSKTKELTTDLAGKARGVNTPARKLLHEWHDDISAPQRTLLFNVDGTFRYNYAPLLGDEKPVKLKGRWTATGGSVTLETGGKSYTLQTRMTQVDNGDGMHTELQLSGDAPHNSLIETFKPAPLLLP